MSSEKVCPKCKARDLLVVRLTPADREMDFHTCRHCENRWWTDVDGGSRVHLKSVIEEISSG